MAANVSASFDSPTQIGGLVPVILYLLLVAIVGLTGNGFVFYVYRTKFRLSTASTFFIWLSLVNIVTCCIVIPVEVVLVLQSYTLKHDWLCKLSRFCNSWTTLATGTILVVIAADRYQKICKLSWRQFNVRRARIGSVGCIAVGLVCSWPSLVLFGKRRVKIPGSDSFGHQCLLSESVSDTYYPLIYEIMYMAVFVSGVVSVTFWYFKIYQKIKSQARKTSSMTSLASIQGFNSTADSSRERSHSLDILSSPYTIEDSSEVEISVSKSDSCLIGGDGDSDYSPRLNRRVTWRTKMVGVAQQEDFTNQTATWKSNEMLIASLKIPARKPSILKRRYTARPERTTTIANGLNPPDQLVSGTSEEMKMIRSQSMRFERSRNTFSSFKQTRTRRPKFRLEVHTPSDENLDNAETTEQNSEKVDNSGVDTSQLNSQTSETPELIVDEPEISEQSSCQEDSFRQEESVVKEEKCAKDSSVSSSETSEGCSDKESPSKELKPSQGSERSAAYGETEADAPGAKEKDETQEDQDATTSSSIGAADSDVSIVQPVMNFSMIVRKKGGSILKPVSPPILTKTLSLQTDDAKSKNNNNDSVESEEEEEEEEGRDRSGTLDSTSELEAEERVPKGRKRTSSITDFGSEILPLSWTERRISWRVYTARRTAYIMCLITASAFFSYIPVLCLETFRALQPDCEDAMTDAGRAAYNFFLRSYFLNVAVSPFVYGAFDSKFRSACGDIVRDVKWKIDGFLHR